jgi:hypothetical protein
MGSVPRGQLLGWCRHAALVLLQARVVAQTVEPVGDKSRRRRSRTWNSGQRHALLCTTGYKSALRRQVACYPVLTLDRGPRAPDGGDGRIYTGTVLGEKAGAEVVSFSVTRVALLACELRVVKRATEARRLVQALLSPRHSALRLSPLTPREGLSLTVRLTRYRGGP